MSGSSYISAFSFGRPLWLSSAAHVHGPWWRESDHTRLLFGFHFPTSYDSVHRKEMKLVSFYFWLLHLCGHIFVFCMYFSILWNVPALEIEHILHTVKIGSFPFSALRSLSVLNHPWAIELRYNINNTAERISSQSSAVLFTLVTQCTVHVFFPNFTGQIPSCLPRSLW